MYKQLTIMSGKGGTGKTTLTASFCRLAQGRIVIVDADVDAANLYILLEHKIEKSEEFIGGAIAYIDPEQCTGCGECFQRCQFDAIRALNGKYIVSERECEGCGVCELVCPVDAVTVKKESVGKLFHSITPYGRFFHAQLYPGGESSGQVVTLLRERAEDAAVAEHKELILIDGPPGRILILRDINPPSGLISARDWLCSGGIIDRSNKGSGGSGADSVRLA